jgi:hypothetical protein
MRPAYQRETPIRDRIAAVGIFASSGWISFENASLVSQVGCVDAPHSEHACACRRREATCFGTCFRAARSNTTKLRSTNHLTPHRGARIAHGAESYSGQSWKEDISGLIRAQNALWPRRAIEFLAPAQQWPTAPVLAAIGVSKRSV